MSDDNTNENPWDVFLPVLALCASVCIGILMLVATYVLARYLLGLV